MASGKSVAERSFSDSHVLNDPNFGWPDANKIRMIIDIPFNDHSYLIGPLGRKTQQLMDKHDVLLHFPDINRSAQGPKLNHVLVYGSSKHVEDVRRELRDRMPIRVSAALSNFAHPDEIMTSAESIIRQNSRPVAWRLAEDMSACVFKTEFRSVNYLKEIVDTCITPHSSKCDPIFMISTPLLPLINVYNPDLSYTLLGYIFKVTNCRIYFPPTLNNISQAPGYFVQGTTIDDVTMAYQFLLGLTTVVLVFPVPSNYTVDYAQIRAWREEFLVDVSIEDVFDKNFDKYLRQATLRTFEFCLKHAYEIRSRMLKLRLATTTTVDSYAFMEDIRRLIPSDVFEQNFLFFPRNIYESDFLRRQVKSTSSSFFRDFYGEVRLQQPIDSSHYAHSLSNIDHEPSLSMISGFEADSTELDSFRDLSLNDVSYNGNNNTNNNNENFDPLIIDESASFIVIDTNPNGPSSSSHVPTTFAPAAASTPHRKKLGATSRAGGNGRDRSNDGRNSQKPSKNNDAGNLSVPDYGHSVINDVFEPEYTFDAPLDTPFVIINPELLPIAFAGLIEAVIFSFSSFNEVYGFGTPLANYYHIQKKMPPMDRVVFRGNSKKIPFLNMIHNRLAFYSRFAVEQEYNQLAAVASDLKPFLSRTQPSNPLASIIDYQRMIGAAFPFEFDDAFIKVLFREGVYAFFRLNEKCDNYSVQWDKDPYDKRFNVNSRRTVSIIPPPQRLSRTTIQNERVLNEALKILNPYVLPCLNPTLDDFNRDFPAAAQSYAGMIMDQIQRYGYESLDLHSSAKYEFSMPANCGPDEFNERLSLLNRYLNRMWAMVKQRRADKKSPEDSFDNVFYLEDNAADDHDVALDPELLEKLRIVVQTIIN